MTKDIAIFMAWMAMDLPRFDAFLYSMKWTPELDVVVATVALLVAPMKVATITVTARLILKADAPGILAEQLTKRAIQELQDDLLSDVPVRTIN